MSVHALGHRDAAGRQIRPTVAEYLNDEYAQLRRLVEGAHWGNVAELGQIAALVDRMTVHAVASRRQFGDSWGSVGESLGITRQAAQQRFSKPWRDAGASWVETELEIDE